MTIETTDPVCKMRLTPDDGTRHTDYAGERHYFCSQRCLDKFQANPTMYARPKSEPPSVYTCPMHPEVQRSGPGTCPECGMALTQAMPPAKQEIAGPLLFGMSGGMLLLLVYFTVVGLISGMDFALDQFRMYWYFIIPLSFGFGLQVGLYTHLRRLVARHGPSGKVLAVSGTTSTAAMVSCCAHYLANIVPLLGVAGFLTVVAEYQVELFWVGLAFNATGIAYIASKVVQAAKEHEKC